MGWSSSYGVSRHRTRAWFRPSNLFALAALLCTISVINLVKDNALESSAIRTPTLCRQVVPQSPRRLVSYQSEARFQRLRRSLVPRGRRSAKIATRKGAQDAAKTKLYTKIGKMVADAVKQGGADPESNVKLAAIMKQAQSANVPKDIIKRNIEKGTSGKANYEQLVYEAYGAGGVGFVIECMTDNPVAAQRDVKQALKKGQGKWAESGSVAFNFAKKGIIRVPMDKVEEDQLFDVALEAGAEDVVEDEDMFKVITEIESFHAVQTALQDAEVPVVGDESGLEMIANTQIEVSDDDADINEDILERLLDIDDVDAVYSTMA